MTFDALEPEVLTSAARRFDDTMQRARARAALLDHAAGRLATLRGRAQSPTGDVEAVVDGNGGLVELRLADPVTGLPAHEVGTKIVATSAAAALDALRHRKEVIADLLADLARYAVPHGC